MTGARRKSPRLKKFASIVGLILIYAAPFLTVVGATDMFLKIGSIKGESVDKDHPDWINTYSFQHGVSRPVNSNVQREPFTITKPLDKATPSVFTELTKGSPNTVELELVRQAGERQRFYRVKLYNALVSAMSFSAKEDMPTETVSFDYSKIELTYTEFNSKGAGTRETTGWYEVPTDKAGYYVTDLSNTAPTISPISNTSTSEDSPVTVSFTVGDSQTAAGSLSVSAVSSSNPTLVPLSNIVFGGSGANRTATVTPAANQTGSTTITVRVADGSLTANSSFVLTVNPINDAPTISAISGQVTEVNTPVTVNFQINDVDHSTDALALTAHSSNQSVVASGNISFSGTDGNRNVTITPNAGEIGDTTITLTVSDGELINNSQFVLSVIEHTPQTPSDVLLSNNSVPENSTNGMLIGNLSAVDSDSTNHVFVLLDSAGGRFRIEGSQLLVENGALLNYELATSHTALVKATDADGLNFSKSLSVQVQNVNESPTFLVSDISIIESVTGQDTPISRLQVADPDAGTDPITLTLQVVNGVLEVSTNFVGTISSNTTAEVTLTGSLTNLNSLLVSTNGLLYRATVNASGTDLLTATVNDNGHTGLGEPHEVYTTLGIRFFRSRYEQWLYGKFSESELNDSALEATLWGPNADADSDGLETLAEYGLGTEPRESDPKPAAGFVMKNGQNYLSLQFNRRQDPQVILSVQVAGDVDGDGWSSAAADLETFPPVDLNNGFDQVRFDDLTATTEATRRFLRMRWTLQNAEESTPGR